MENLIIPENYRAPLTIRETEVAIKEIKDISNAHLQNHCI